MKPVIRGATTADIEQLVETRCAFTFEDAEPSATSRLVWSSDVSGPFYRRHGFEVPGDPLLSEPKAR